MNYGEYLDKNIGIFSLIDSYFNHPTMKKTSDDDCYSIYMCKLHSLLSIQYRVIVAVTLRDNNSIGDTEFLADLNWVSFQTRTLEKINKLSTHKYSVKRSKEYNIPITYYKKDENASYYETPEYPITITLLHTKNNKHYQLTGTLVNALETFNTIITFNKET